jgi:hypothetical protein
VTLADVAFFDPLIPSADLSFPSANRAPYIPPIPNPLNRVPHSVHPELSPSTLIALQDYGGLPLALVVAPRANLPRFRLDIPGPPTSSSSPNRALFLPISSSSPSRALFPLASSSHPQRLLFSETVVIGCWRRQLRLVQVFLNSTLISLVPPHLELLPKPGSLSPRFKLSPSTPIVLRRRGDRLLAPVVAPRASVPQFHLDILGPPHLELLPQPRSLSPYLELLP